ncbi:hypothetical protein D3C75_1020250 [compost metagenome]
MRLLPVRGAPIIDPVAVDLVEVVHTPGGHPVHRLLAPAGVDQHRIHSSSHIHIIRPDAPDRPYLHRSVAVIEGGEAGNIPFRQNLVHHVRLAQAALGTGSRGIFHHHRDGAAILFPV